MHREQICVFLFNVQGGFICILSIPRCTRSKDQCLYLSVHEVKIRVSICSVQVYPDKNLCVLNVPGVSTCVYLSVPRVRIDGLQCVFVCEL